MSEDSKRQRAVLVLWFARGLGLGGLLLALQGLTISFFAPGFLVLGLAVMVLALVVAVPTNRRVRKLKEQAEGSPGGDESAAVGLAGFTLGCGLLVGTLTLLMWLLPSHVWPGGHSVETPHKVVCFSNVKNLALALQMYVEDNGDMFPPATGWCDSLEEYVKNDSVFLCPEAPDLRCAYAYNRALSGMRLSDTADRAATVAIFESGVGWNAAGDASILPAAPRHLEGDNYGFADGHVMWVEREKLALGKAGIDWSVERGE